MFNQSIARLSLIPLLYVLSGCDSSTESAASAETPPAAVKVKTLALQPVTLDQAFPGRVAAFRTAQIRPQVSGIITGMSFSQGSEVRPGQALFQIDPAPFRADVNSAAAAVEKAQANYRQLQARAARLEKLRGSGAISQQDYEDAASNAAQAKATVAETRATLARRQLDLSYATVKAPIGGRIDQNFVTEGALVSSSDSQAMATVQQIDRVYVDVRQPASAMHALPVTAAAQKEAPVRADILSATGEPFSNSTRILFTGVTVDAGTGDVIMRIEAENPERTLLPGMYVQAKISRQLAAEGVVIPQEALVRNGETTQVWLDDGGKAKAVPVELGEALNGNYFVRSGVKAGDRLITQGAGKLQDGMPIQTGDEKQHP
ncbi:efflux RND transporter periplasmic adaptor subunit [Pectobacterium versatile]|uniref:Efflux RND transporter periplasmic adaptor subunit n=1 Tax=Klebsiella huaxiensis TaxID=2153354 RepID=A0ABT6EIU0_9ENTR|nr:MULTISPECIES: efflux RND transporter periplasmic adaptor subunit [Enterobacterales]MBN3059088.1 efflux RND transporter periplasmic adaptor subunit [Pectobacterium versatile]MDG1644175.1 efflux RND transporter periplasmic adaptor subunit [Klebsiella huaxiensis]